MRAVLGEFVNPFALIRYTERDESSNPRTDAGEALTPVTSHL
jgi:hypothetical protein